LKSLLPNERARNSGPNPILAQIEDGGSEPYSFSAKFSTSEVPVVNVASIDLAKVQADDVIEDAKESRVPRMGIIVPVNKGLNDGQWIEFSNENRLLNLPLYFRFLEL
jgi:hypothetical protein